MKKINIGLYMGSWPQNIGNAFFDLGAYAILKEAMPDAVIHRVGGATHWMFNASFNHLKNPIERKLRRRFNQRQTISNSIEIPMFANLDLVVFAGMSMCAEFVANNGPTFMELAKRKIPVLLLGTGGALYDKDEPIIFSNFLKKFSDFRVITRDDDTYKMFEPHLAGKMVAGIDCAFSLPRYLSPLSFDCPDFNVECFDEIIPPPVLNHSRQVFRAHHDMWGPLPKHYIDQPNCLISDVPEDYLNLYANSKITYSDRVHACVATLAYGNEARLFSSTPRKSLFNKLGVDNITSTTVRLDMANLKKLQDNQVVLAKKYIQELVVPGAK
ncbi:MAG: hypothetical protein COW01_03590 [Bdellovibrionales bacterium CG12_big_fil_rev_8_21_14_0_65_38_15]|nr:MAG: hypothetical protein COW01_03590 [Bdellovibrionales bacterium CG12_big_fil_rev_8_21_14_0_65_38_15]